MVGTGENWDARRGHNSDGSRLSFGRTAQENQFRGGLDLIRHNVYIDIVSDREFKRMRQSIGYSQAKLAKEMGVTVRSITRWETGQFPIPKMAELALRFVVQQASNRKGR